MKKKTIFSWILVMLTMGSMISIASAKGIENNLVDYEDTAYVFSVLPGSEEWAKFQTKEEKLAVCQIPETKISLMTTETLLESVLKYPFINEYFFFDSIEDACNRMYEDFNGLRALLDKRI